MIMITLSTGQVLRFPDGTPPDVIERARHRVIAGEFDAPAPEPGSGSSSQIDLSRLRNHPNSYDLSHLRPEREIAGPPRPIQGLPDPYNWQIDPHSDLRERRSTGSGWEYRPRAGAMGQGPVAIGHVEGGTPERSLTRMAIDRSAAQGAPGFGVLSGALDLAETIPAALGVAGATAIDANVQAANVGRLPLLAAEALARKAAEPYRHLTRADQREAEAVADLQRRGFNVEYQPWMQRSNVPDPMAPVTGATSRLREQAVENLAESSQNLPTPVATGMFHAATTAGLMADASQYLGGEGRPFGVGEHAMTELEQAAAARSGKYLPGAEEPLIYFDDKGYNGSPGWKGKIPDTYRDLTDKPWREYGPDHTPLDSPTSVSPRPRSVERDPLPLPPINPGLSATDADVARIAGLWDYASRRYPAIASRIKRMELGTPSGGSAFEPTTGTLTLSVRADLGTMMHELVHVAQDARGQLIRPAELDAQGLGREAERLVEPHATRLGDVYSRIPQPVKGVPVGRNDLVPLEMQYGIKDGWGTGWNKEHQAWELHVPGKEVRYFQGEGNHEAVQEALKAEYIDAHPRLQKLEYRGLAYFGQPGDLPPTNVLAATYPYTEKELAEQGRMREFGRAVREEAELRNRPSVQNERLLETDSPGDAVVDLSDENYRVEIPGNGNGYDDLGRSQPTGLTNVFHQNPSQELRQKFPDAIIDSRDVYEGPVNLGPERRVRPKPGTALAADDVDVPVVPDAAWEAAQREINQWEVDNPLIESQSYNGIPYLSTSGYVPESVARQWDEHVQRSMGDRGLATVHEFTGPRPDPRHTFGDMLDEAGDLPVEVIDPAVESEMIENLGPEHYSRLKSIVESARSQEPPPQVAHFPDQTPLPGEIRTTAKFTRNLDRTVDLELRGIDGSVERYNWADDSDLMERIDELKSQLDAENDLSGSDLAGLVSGQEPGYVTLVDRLGSHFPDQQRPWLHVVRDHPELPTELFGEPMLPSEAGQAARLEQAERDAFVHASVRPFKPSERGSIGPPAPSPVPVIPPLPVKSAEEFAAEQMGWKIPDGPPHATQPVDPIRTEFGQTNIAAQIGGPDAGYFGDAEAAGYIYENSEEVFRQLGPPQTWDTLEEMAKMSGTTKEQFLDNNPRWNVHPPAERLRLLYVNRGIREIEIPKLHAKIVAGVATDADKAELLRLKDQAGELLKFGARSASEYGRALNSTKMEARIALGNDHLLRQRLYRQYASQLDEQKPLLNALALLDPNNPEELQTFLRQVDKPKFREYVQEAWVSSILSGLATHERNFIGNNVNALMENLVVRPMAAGFDAARVFGTDLPREVFMREFYQSGLGLTRGIRDGIRAGLEVIKRGYDPVTMQGKLFPMRSAFARSQNRFVREMVGPVATMPLRMLAASDALFKSMNWTTELYAQAAKIASKEGLSGEALTDKIAHYIKNPSEEMKDAANAFALKSTFNDEASAVGKAIMTVRDLPGASSANPGIQGLLETYRAGMGFILPFIKIADRLMVRGLEYTPLGAIPAIGARRAGNFAQAADLSARSAFGSVILAYAASLAMEGRLTAGAPTDEGEKAAFLGAHKQAWSVRTENGEWIPFGGLQPIGTPFALAAAFWNGWQKNEEAEAPTVEKLGSAVQQIGVYETDQSYMDALSKFMDAIGGSNAEASRAFSDLATNTVWGFHPYSGMTRSIARAIDPRVIDAETIGQRLQQNIPGQSLSMVPRLTPWGEDVVPVGGRLRTVLAPGSVLLPSKEKLNPLDQELDRLGMPIGYVGKSIADKFPEGKSMGTWKLDQKEWNLYQRTSGRTSKMLLELLFSQPEYADWDIEAQRDEVGKVIEASRKYARIQMVRYRRKQIKSPDVTPSWSEYAGEMEPEAPNLY